MEVGVAPAIDAAFTSSPEHSLGTICLTLAVKRSDFLLARWWKFVFIGVALACCSSLLCASYPLELRSFVSSFDISSYSVSSIREAWAGRSRNRLDRRELLSEGRNLEELGSLNDNLGGRIFETEPNVFKEFRVATEKLIRLAENDGKEDQETTNPDDQHGEKVESEPGGNAASELRGIDKLLVGLEDDVGGGNSGIFNKTISEQEGVLETVARVGKHSFDEDQNEADGQESDLTLQAADTEVGNETLGKADILKMEGSAQAVVDLSLSKDTWFDRIMGKNQVHPDQSRQLEANASSVKDSQRKDDLQLQEKKNSTKEKTTDDGGGRHQVEDVPRLIDREDNEYVISNPGKSSQLKLQEDFTLISDIVIVIVAAALGGTFCGYCGQPVILGYLAAGMVVGPGGLNLVHELVQVETLAQFGVVFLLFALGVEFSVSKMQGVHGVALGGGCLEIAVAMLLGGLLGSSAPQGVFIGAFLSMSSTAVVVKCLVDSNMSGTEHGQIMLGTLLLQDFALGLLLAVMPALAAKDSSAGMFAFVLSKEGMLLLGFCGVAWIISKLFIPHFLQTLVRLMKFNSELYQLGVVGVCLLMAFTSHCLGLSMEVGAFISGLMFSGGVHTEKTLHQVEPIRNVFAALFLASIGMVMNPIFLWQHKDILLASLGVVFFGKACLVAIVVRAFGYTCNTSLSVGIALAQIGEFSFILLSRAQSLGLVSKKLYLLLMGTSALSLVLTPFAFKIVNVLMPVDVREKKARHSVLHKIYSKPSYSQPWLEPNISVSNIGGHQENAGSSHWTSLDIPVEGTDNSESLLVSTVVGQDIELRDLEDGRGDRSLSPTRVLLRRPFAQIFSSRWNESKEPAEVPRDHHRTQ